MQTRYEIGTAVTWCELSSRQEKIRDAFGIVVRDFNNALDIVEVDVLPDGMKYFDADNAVEGRDDHNVRILDVPPFSLLDLSSDGRGCCAFADPNACLHMTYDEADKCELCDLGEDPTSKRDLKRIFEHLKPRWLDKQYMYEESEPSQSNVPRATIEDLYGDLPVPQQATEDSDINASEPVQPEPASKFSGKFLYMQRHFMKDDETCPDGAVYDETGPNH